MNISQQSLFTDIEIDSRQQFYILHKYKIAVLGNDHYIDGLHHILASRGDFTTSIGDIDSILTDREVLQRLGYTIHEQQGLPESQAFYNPFRKVIQQKRRIEYCDDF